MERVHRNAAPEEGPASGVRSIEERLLPKGWWAQLVSLRGRIYQVYFYLYTFNLYHLVGRDYRAKYETLAWNGDTATSQTVSYSHQSPKVRRQVQRSEHRSCRNWFPPMPKTYVFVRYMTTIYMIYIFIKSLMFDQVKYLIGGLNLEKPAHCYILGKFKIHYRINQQVGPVFASFHLIWRVIMFFCSKHRRIANSTIFFLMLDEQQVENYYKFLANKRFIEAKRRRPKRRGPAGSLSIPSVRYTQEDDETNPVKMAPVDKQLMQDVMSYHFNWNGVTTLRLRPNRTPEARQHLIKFQARVTFWAIVIFIPIAVGVATALISHALNHERYLNDYPNCDPLIEQLAREHRLGDWVNYHPFRHVNLAFTIDILENVILWLESGLVSVCFVSYSLTFNYDNLLYWAHIQQKIASLLSLARDLKMGQMQPGQMSNYPADNLDDWTLSIHELHIEMADFVKQWAQSNKILTDLVSMALTVWFILFATFNYGVIANKEKGFPIELSLVLMFVFAVMSSCWFILLRLHKRCLQSYASLCSLMALDHSKHKKRFTRLLDYFVRQKVSYTVYRSYPITGATFLTLIGYSFSCFFILASSRNR